MRFPLHCSFDSTIDCTYTHNRVVDLTAHSLRVLLSFCARQGMEEWTECTGYLKYICVHMKKHPFILLSTNRPFLSNLPIRRHRFTPTVVTIVNIDRVGSSILLSTFAFVCQLLPNWTTVDWMDPAEWCTHMVNLVPGFYEYVHPHTLHRCCPLCTQSASIWTLTLI